MARRSVLRTAALRGERIVRSKESADDRYLIGLLVMVLGTGAKVSQRGLQEYTAALSKVDIATQTGLRLRVQDDMDEYYQSKGWFFSCNEACQANYAKYERSRRELERVEALNNAALSNARAKLGIFSEFAVGDARDLFWDNFYRAAAFAKRMSMWDALILSINSMHRDESLWAVILRWLLQVLLNFTIGMVSAFISFAFHLAKLVFSYQPSSLGGLSFFILAICGAASFFLSFLVGLFLATASASFVVSKLAGPNFRIEYGGGMPRRHIRGMHHD